MNCKIRPLFVSLIMLWLALPVSAQVRHALLVGISEYNPVEEVSAYVWDNIHGANDVDMMQGVLRKQGFDEAHIIALRNQEATASAIRSALSALTQSCQDGDMVYIHFSCHGQLVEDLDGDEADGWDEALIPYDAQKYYRKGIYEGENHLCDDELHQWILSLRKKLGPQGMLYVTLDACHIGEAYMTDVPVRGTNLVFTPKGKQYIKADVVRQNRRSHRPIQPGQGVAPICMLEACRAYEFNMEKRVEGTYFGALSYFVAQVLSEESIQAASAWWQQVRRMLDADQKLINQHLVIESSL